VDEGFVSSVGTEELLCCLLIYGYIVNKEKERSYKREKIDRI